MVAAWSKKMEGVMVEQEDGRRAEGSLEKPCFLPARPPERNSVIGMESLDGRQ